MNECADRKWTWRRTGFKTTSPEERTLELERARQIMKLPLDYVPDEHFQAWIRDEKTEKEVLEPMPACGGSPAKAEPPSGISPYMAGLYEVPLLNREQEAHLFRRMNYLKYKASVFRGRLDPVRPRESQMAQIEKLYQEILATRNQIICANLRLVTSIAKRYQGLGRDIFELISDGNVSLMRAVERFDYSSGNRFSTYASWAIINNFARDIPKSLRQQTRFRTGGTDLFGATPDVRGNQREVEAAQSRRETALDGILRRLDDRERKILVYRFGLRRGYEPQTLKQVGGVLGVTKERIRQIEARALEKLREIVVKERPPELMDGGDW